MRHAVPKSPATYRFYVGSLMTTSSIVTCSVRSCGLDRKRIAQLLRGGHRVTQCRFMHAEAYNYCAGVTEIWYPPDRIGYPPDGITVPNHRRFGYTLGSTIPRGMLVPSQGVGLSPAFYANIGPLLMIL